MALVVWVVGLELFPTAHLAAHDVAPMHSHGGVVHHHARAEGDRVGPESVDPDHGRGSPHGEGSAAHHDELSRPDVPELPSIARPRLGEAASELVHVASSGYGRSVRAEARGPPRRRARTEIATETGPNPKRLRDGMTVSETV